MNQFEIWRARPEGFARAHFFIILSGQERCADARTQQYNALGCFTLRGKPGKLEVVLNGADGLDCPKFFHPPPPVRPACGIMAATNPSLSTQSETRQALLTRQEWHWQMDLPVNRGDGSAFPVPLDFRLSRYCPTNC